MDQQDNEIYEDSPFLDETPILEDAPLDEQPTPEEIEAAEQDEILARRIRREVKRMERGDADEDLAKDAEAEEQERVEREAEEEAERKEQQHRANNIFWLLLSGNILQKESVSKYYSQLVAIAVLFFISIFVMFWSLHLDMRYNQELRMVQLLRERSARLQELRYSKCSHSAISAELERRGLKLSDPTHPAVVIEHKGWFNR